MPGTKRIRLNSRDGIERFAYVDREDYLKVSQWRWCFSKDANSPDPDYGYAVRCKKKSDPPGLTCALGRFIAGTPKGLEADHKDGNPLNNRQGNVRNATRAQNLANRGVFRNSKSGHKGVRFNEKTKKWEFRLMLVYDTIEEAISRSEELRRISFGEFYRPPKT